MSGNHVIRDPILGLVGDASSCFASTTSLYSSMSAHIHDISTIIYIPNPLETETI